MSRTTDGVEKKFLASLEKHASGATDFVVAVSGGADSMCLLTLFNKYSSERGLNLIAAHFEHGIRGSESLRDMDFVRRECLRLGVKFVCSRADVPGEARLAGESVEACARRLRYAFLESVKPGALIATAHNCGDNLETMLLNLTRGASLGGLCGIPPLRGNIIRPLLAVTRDEIESYCEENGIPYVTDSTNLSDDYSRNKIRHCVAPVLKEINGGVEAAAFRASELLREENDFLESMAEAVVEKSEESFGYSVKPLLEADAVIARRALRIICFKLGCSEPERRHIEELLRKLGGGSVNLPGSVTAVVEDGIISARRGTADVHLDFHGEGEYALPGKTITARRVDKKEIIQYNKKQLCFGGFAEASALEGAAFRFSRPGDTFVHGGSGHEKKLVKILADLKIPASRREGLAVLAKENRVLWCELAGVSGETLPGENNKGEILCITT